MPDTRNITVTVNGEAYSRAVETRLTLADFLRHELNLTGTHVGCEHGVCGACTVLVGGMSVRACLLLAVQCEGQKVVTVESLAVGGRLNPLQQAFQDHHGLQCGFCTPGILMTLTEFLREHPDPGEAEVREALTGNLCRCTGYQAIVAATLDAAKRMQAAHPSPQPAEGGAGSVGPPMDAPRTRSLAEWCGKGRTRLRSTFPVGACAAAPANGPPANESQPPPKRATVRR